MMVKGFRSNTLRCSQSTRSVFKLKLVGSVMRISWRVTNPRNQVVGKRLEEAGSRTIRSVNPKFAFLKQQF